MKSLSKGTIAVITLLFLSVGLHAQKITLNHTNEPLKTVLKSIEAQTDYTFVYSNVLSVIEDPVNINASEQALEETLKTLLKPIGIAYRVTDTQIILTPEEMVPQSTPGQTRIKVSGVITDQQTGEAIPYAALVIKENNTLRSISDEQGKYTIEADNGSQTITVMYTGYATVDMPINNRGVINIQMSIESTLLEEVMVVAYGTTTRASFTGSAGKIDSKELELRPVTNISDALSGTTPGVMINSANGHPGSDATIRIRGLGSLNASNDPLVILDGVPYAGAFSSLNPTDIESLTILKDASSSALYGARAANGVIVITTKRGLSEKPQLTFKMTNGFTSRELKEYSRVGISDYMELYWENLVNKYTRDGMSTDLARETASNNLISQFAYNPFNVAANQVVGTNGKLNPGANFLWSDDTDWESAVQQPGYSQDYSVSINGRNEKSDYYASVGYTNQQGYIIGSQFQRYSGRANVNTKLTDWLKVGFNLGANMSSSSGIQDEGMGNLSNPFLFTRYIGPIYPIHLHNPVDGSYVMDELGNKIYDFGVGYDLGNGVTVPKRDFASGNNPAIELRNRVNQYKRNMMTAKPYVEISFLKDFTFTASAALTANAYLGSTAAVVYPEKLNTGSATKSNSFTTTWTVNQLLTWKKSFGKHKIDVLVGHESYQYDYNYLTASLKDQIVSDNYELANYVNINTQPNSYTHTYRTEGYLSRVNYNYNEKYILSASFRRDGSSRFYMDARWGNFFSVGGAWRIEQEPFIKKISFIDELKLRASFGQVGNDNIGGYYPWQALYTKSQNANEAGYVQSSLGNQNLQWEVNNSYDIALEFGLFKFLRGSVEYFYRVSSNLLFSVPLSPSTGMSSQDMNAGSMYNSGVEFQLGFDIIKKRDLKWSIDINGAMLKNEVTSLPREPYTINSSYQRIEEGHSRYEWWLLQWAGVNPENGDCLYAPRENATSLVTVNGTTYTNDINQALEDWSGSPIPKIYGGIRSGFSYKNFEFSVLFSYQLGGKMYDFSYYNLMSPNNRSNQSLHTDILNRWTTPGQQSDIPRLDDGAAATSLRAQRSTRWLISSDMLELKNVSVAYTLPRRWSEKVGISNLRLFASGDNIFIFNHKQGMNSNYSINGYDNNGDRYSPSRTIVLGLTFTL